MERPPAGTAISRDVAARVIFLMASGHCSTEIQPFPRTTEISQNVGNILHTYGDISIFKVALGGFSLPQGQKPQASSGLFFKVFGVSVVCVQKRTARKAEISKQSDSLRHRHSTRLKSSPVFSIINLQSSIALTSDLLLRQQRPPGFPGGLCPSFDGWLNQEEI
jgi:hypothetical protein